MELGVPVVNPMDIKQGKLLLDVDMKLLRALCTLNLVVVILGDMLLVRETIFGTDGLVDTLILVNTELVLVLGIHVVVFILVDTDEVGTLLLVVDIELVLEVVEVLVVALDDVLPVEDTLLDIT